MAGSRTAVLSGFATPARLAPMWDHTYVVSDCGWAWQCWGACGGGSLLTHAPGNSLIANCLSKPQGTAGLRYGRDGVCHQTANRILDPAGIRVSSARGYGQSLKFWGHYGSSPWTRKSICYSGSDGTPEHKIYEASIDQRQAGQKDPIMASGTDDSIPHMAFVNADGSREDQLSEIREMCNSHISEPISDEEAIKLLRIRVFAREEQQRLNMACDAGDLSPASYLHMMVSLTSFTAGQEERTLGKQRFLEVFGEAGLHPEGIIDPAAFYESMQVDGEKARR